MAKRLERVEIGELDKAIRQVLDEYHGDVTERINVASEKTAKRLVKLTRATAPVGHRGKFKRYITYSEVGKSKGSFAGRTFVWHVRPPEYRLTHLLVHGHATRDGGRTRANPFLHNAVDTVAPEYEAKIKEAVRNG